MEPVVKVALEGDLPSYTTDDYEICGSKAHNRGPRPRLGPVTQQVESIELVCGQNELQTQ